MINLQTMTRNRLSQGCGNRVLRSVMAEAPRAKGCVDSTCLNILIRIEQIAPLWHPGIPALAPRSKPANGLDANSSSMASMRNGSSGSPASVSSVTTPEQSTARALSGDQCDQAAAQYHRIKPGSQCACAYGTEATAACRQNQTGAAYQQPITAATKKQTTEHQRVRHIRPWKPNVRRSVGRAGGWMIPANRNKPPLIQVVLHQIIQGRAQRFLSAKRRYPPTGYRLTPRPDRPPGRSSY